MSLQQRAESCRDYLDGYGTLIDAKRKRPKDVVDISRITGRLYLGSYKEGASAYEGLKILGITHILTVGVDMPVVFPDLFVYKVVELWDDPSEDIERHFDECHEFIQGALQESTENNVFVHCFAGISRSATIVISYLIKKYRYGYAEAYETVRRARYFINPNRGFRETLQRLARECCGDDENRQKEYEHAVEVLQKDYRGEPVTEDQRCEVMQTFKRLFGPFHPHVLDLRTELDLLQNVLR